MCVPIYLWSCVLCVFMCWNFMAIINRVYTVINIMCHVKHICMPLLLCGHGFMFIFFWAYWRNQVLSWANQVLKLKLSCCGWGFQSHNETGFFAKLQNKYWMQVCANNFFHHLVCFTIWGNSWSSGNWNWLVLGWKNSFLGKLLRNVLLFTGQISLSVIAEPLLVNLAHVVV